MIDLKKLKKAELLLKLRRLVSAACWTVGASNYGSWEEEYESEKNLRYLLMDEFGMTDEDFEDDEDD